MSILIRGMEMPEEGYRQVFITSDGKAIYFPSTPQNGEEQYEVIPDADVQPVVRGKWKLNNDGSGTCSVCHFTQSAVWDDDGWQNFCGHCGADMRLVKKGEIH